MDVNRLCKSRDAPILAIMKLDSKFFDSIRVSSRRPAPERADHPRCHWKGCADHGLYRAPKGRGREGQFFLFCMTHVREYNASYNYFDGMSAPEVEDYQKAEVTGHRPTWKMGTGPMGPSGAFPLNGEPEFSERASDPHAFFSRRAREKREEAQSPRRPTRPLERKHLETLRLAEGATRGEIKARFKELVKRHHPDLNGGDNRSEDRLREVIQAYNFLKQAGLA